MRITIETQPNLTEECQTYISNQINFVYSGDDTDLYAIDYVLEELSGEIEQNGGEEIFGISLLDIKELERLMNEQVSYIELNK